MLAHKHLLVQSEEPLTGDRDHLAPALQVLDNLQLLLGAGAGKHHLLVVQDLIPLLGGLQRRDNRIRYAVGA